MKQTIVAVFVLLFAACKQHQPAEPRRHEALLGFKAIYVAEPGDATDHKYQLDSKLHKLRIRYVEDIIYVSTYARANACGQHFANMQTRHDTIVLTYQFADDTACLSQVIEKITYLIDNPKKCKRKIRFE